MHPVKRTPEVVDAINAAEDAGDYEQAGYLMAPGLQQHTGESFEQMLVVAATLDALGYPKPEYELYNKGLIRWAKEQIEQQNAVKH